jgi:hypothetical protein
MMASLPSGFSRSETRRGWRAALRGGERRPVRVRRRKVNNREQTREKEGHNRFRYLAWPRAKNNRGAAGERSDTRLRQLGLVAALELWTRGSDLQLGLRGGGARRLAYIGGFGVEARQNPKETGIGRGGLPSEGVRLAYELEVEDALSCGPGVAVKQREGTTGSRLRLWAGPLARGRKGKGSWAAIVS